jgi:hypothetical protein
VRLILDGTVVRVRLDRRATSISLLAVLGVRADGQKVLLAIRSMGGESETAWRALLDDLIKRGLRTPELVIADGAPGLEKARARCGPRRRSSAARCTSTTICSRTRPRACTTKSPGQIVMRKVDGWQSLADKPPHDWIAWHRPKTRRQIPTQLGTGPWERSRDDTDCGSHVGTFFTRDIGRVPIWEL